MSETAETKSETKPELPMRPVVVLRRCFTEIDHNPGEIVHWKGDLPESGIFRELTDDERDEFDATRAQHADDPSLEPEPDRVDVREDFIRKAVGLLDPNLDSDWLMPSGQPAMSAINRNLLKLGAVPDTTTRAEVRKVMGDIKRPDPPAKEGAASDVAVPLVGMAPSEAD
jgi:hypothetical protein